MAANLNPFASEFNPGFGSAASAASKALSGLSLGVGVNMDGTKLSTKGTAMAPQLSSNGASSNDIGHQFAANSRTGFSVLGKDTVCAGPFPAQFSTSDLPASQNVRTNSKSGAPKPFPQANGFTIASPVAKNADAEALRSSQPFVKQTWSGIVDGGRPTGTPPRPNQAVVSPLSQQLDAKRATSQVSPLSSQLNGFSSNTSTPAKANGNGAAPTAKSIFAAFDSSKNNSFTFPTSASQNIPTPRTPALSPSSSSHKIAGSSPTLSEPITIQSKTKRAQVSMEEMEAIESELNTPTAPKSPRPNEDCNFDDCFDTHSVPSRTSSVDSRLSRSVSEQLPSPLPSPRSSPHLPTPSICDDTRYDSHPADASVAREPAGASETSETTTADTQCTAERQASEAEQAVAEAAAEMLQDGPVCRSAVTGAPAVKVGPQDFLMLRVVGQGAFGKVFQVQYKATGHVYAMKVMRKERILQRDHGEYVRSERDVLTAVFHPYIVTLRFSFQTPTKLYLVLDFINGGHLFFNLYRQGVFSEDVARLYTAEMVSALTYLHSRGIVHRDLKPENVLLDTEGHLQLTDFGLAKGNMGGEGVRTNSFIGTMEYMAPEIIDGKGHGKEVDWWSTGILLYEMLCGIPPFRAKSRNALQTQILTSKIKYPKFLSSDALSLLKGLLTRDVTKRLGHGDKGSDAIKRHPFFKSVNWAKLERREIESKFKPMVTNSLCVENFDKIWTDQPAEDSPCGTPNAASLGQFQGFTYIAPSFLTGAMERGPAAAAAAGAV